MTNVLINVYACNPYWGSEQGLGWNWVKSLGKLCNLHVITEGEFKDNIEIEISKLSYSGNITFYYNPLPDKVRKMCWNQGDWRFYYYYNQWQKSTLKIAQGIIKDNKIDIIHQSNMGGFREPGYLWKIKDIPFIWGPVDAKEKFPIAYLENASFKLKFFLRIKNIITKLQLRYSLKVKKAVENATIIVSASSDSKKSFQKYFRRDTYLIHDTAFDFAKNTNLTLSDNKAELNLLWVGKFDFRKQLDLALKTIERLKAFNVNIHIVGGASEEENIFKKRALKLGISKQCKWYGMVAHDEISKLMLKNDVFFFTSVAEGTPTVVMEAIGNHLPVICFDTCGHGDVVTKDIGLKVKLSNPKISVNDFSEAILYLYNHREVLNDFKKHCELKKYENTWDYRANQMIQLYEKSLNLRYLSNTK